MNEGQKQLFWCENGNTIQPFGWDDSPGMHDSTINAFTTYAFTIMCWIKCFKVVDGGNEFFGIRTGSANQYGFSLMLDSSGKIAGCQQNIAMIFTDDYLPLEQWNHLAFTRDSTGCQIKVYLNGQLIHSTVCRAPGGYANKLTIPWKVNCGSTHLAKLSVHDIEFSAEEISNEIKKPTNIQHTDSMRSLFVNGIVDGVLVDSCNKHNITVNDKLFNVNELF